MSRECRVCGRAMLYSRLHECLMEPTRAEAPQGETQVIHGYTFPSFPAAQPETGGCEARVLDAYDVILSARNSLSAGTPAAIIMEFDRGLALLADAIAARRRSGT